MTGSREVLAVVEATGATSVHVAGDVTRYSRGRVERLAPGSAPTSSSWCTTGRLFVVPPGDVTATGKDHMAVFTPYFRRWQREPTRDLARTPRSLRLPDGLARGRLPAVDATGGR